MEFKWQHYLNLLRPNPFFSAFVSDWSLWYIIVGSIAIGIGITGIMWTVCTCWHR